MTPRRPAGAGAAETRGDALLRSLVAPGDWRIHVRLLQELPAVDIPKRGKAALHRLLLRDLSHANKFVRAWAYGGLVALARRFPEFEDEANAICEMGLRDESAAIRARIRNARGETRASARGLPRGR